MFILGDFLLNLSIIPESAHSAYDKAAQYFNLKLRRVPVNKEFQADVKAIRRCINRNTILVCIEEYVFLYASLSLDLWFLVLIKISISYPGPLKEINLMPLLHIKAAFPAKFYVYLLIVLVL